jgi:DNA polymerase-4
MNPETLKTIMHIDFDSFFASVEQQANPFLRGKPIGVTGSSLTRGVICAASREAKQFGVKTGMPLFKAREVCPHIIPVKGDSSKYSYIQDQTLQIYQKYTDQIEPFSIDETFIDVTSTLKFFQSPTKLAELIKSDFCKLFGEYVTCSVGIAFNKLLAKLASDLNKPNGICLVTKNNLSHILHSVKLKDFCGIGPRIEARLNKLGIFTVKDLQEVPIEILYCEFGMVESRFLKDTSFGNGDILVSGLNYKHEKPKSIGHQHTLSQNTKDLRVIKKNLHRLCQMATRRMRKYNMKGKTITVTLRNKQKQWFGGRTTLFLPTYNDMEIYEAGCEVLRQMQWNQETRLVGVSISNLMDADSLNLDLFSDHQKLDKIIKAKDLINDAFGDFTVITADTLRADQTRGKISSFLRY